MAKPGPSMYRTSGMNSRTAKLDDTRAQAILDAKGKASSRDVAEQHGVSTNTVLNIWARRNWRHLKQSNSTEGNTSSAC